MPVPEEVGRFYDRLTLSVSTELGNNFHIGYWDDPDSEIPFDEAANRLTDIMTDKLKIGPGSHVLDVGCGVGGPGVRIAMSTDARITGISVSHEQVVLANSLAESAGVADRVAFQQVNAMEMPFPSESFDAAIALESIAHMDRGQALTQICQSLRPGGRLVLTDIFERVPTLTGKQPVFDFLSSMMSTIVKVEDYPPLLQQAGLRFEEILDITEHSIPKSRAYLLALFKEMLPKFEEMFGDEAVRQLDATGHVLDTLPFGYLMLVAKRPEK
jgi:cyclopropane fatty-acyl-phospholipid synthase-like methyltransferase